MFVRHALIVVLVFSFSLSGQLVPSDRSPKTIPSIGATDADPFDIVTGIYYREYLDLYVEDSMPLKFVRTQRNMDSRSRAFGIGGSTSYDMFIIGDAQKFSWVALVDAQGSQTRFLRASPGTGMADAVFENTTAPSEFLGSRIFWNHGAWTAKLRDGTEYTMQACSPSSKPGQCAVTEIKNAKGERIVIQRDHNGNITRITSPHQHYISIKCDSADRIIRAEDDAGHWVTYEYDPAGWLKKAQTWRGEIDEFRYDKRLNMVWVGERDQKLAPGKYRFTVTNQYGSEDRFKWQKVDFGDSVQFFSAAYHEDGQGKVREVDVRTPEGLSHYYFNADGYETREAFVPTAGPRWSLEFTRNPATDATVDAILLCPAGRVHLPPTIADRLAGEGHQGVVSRACAMKARARQNPAAGIK